MQHSRQSTCGEQDLHRVHAPIPHPVRLAALNQPHVSPRHRSLIVTICATTHGTRGWRRPSIRGTHDTHVAQTAGSSAARPRPAPKHQHGAHTSVTSSTHLDGRVRDVISAPHGCVAYRGVRGFGQRRMVLVRTLRVGCMAFTLLVASYY